MSNRANKPKKFCRVGVYLQHKYPVLYQNIQDLCLGGILSTSRGKAVTFIVPDKKTQSKINKLVGTDPEAAVTLLKCHTITKQVNSMSEFGDGVPCANGKEIRAVNTTSTYAELSNGVKLTKSKDYLKLYPDQRDDVLIATGGEVSVSNGSSNSDSKPASKKGAGRNRYGGSYTGGNDKNVRILQDTKAKQSNDAAHIADVLLQYSEIKTESTYYKDHLLSTLASLYNYIKTTDSKLYNLLKKLKVYGAYSPVSIIQILLNDNSDNKATLSGWKLCKNEYDVAEELTNISKRDVNCLGYDFISHKRGKIIKNMGLNATNICTVMCEKLEEYLSSKLTEEKSTVFEYWGGYNQLACFLLAHAEVEYVFGRKYIDNIASQGPPLNRNELKNINGIVKNTLLRGDRLKGNRNRCDWSSSLCVFDQKVMNGLGIPKQMFCTALRIWLDSSLLSPGFDSIANEQSETVNQVNISFGNVEPNSLQATSNDKKWQKAVELSTNLV